MNADAQDLEQKAREILGIVLLQRADFVRGSEVHQPHLEYGLEHGFYDKSLIDRIDTLFRQDLAREVLALVGDEGTDFVRGSKFYSSNLEYGLDQGLYDQGTIEYLNKLSKFIIPQNMGTLVVKCPNSDCGESLKMPVLISGSDSDRIAYKLALASNEPVFESTRLCLFCGTDQPFQIPVYRPKIYLLEMIETMEMTQTIVQLPLPDFAGLALRCAHRASVEGNMEKVERSMNEWETYQNNVDSHILRARKAAYLANFYLISSPNPKKNPNRLSSLEKYVLEVLEELPYISPGPDREEIELILNELKRVDN